MRSWYSAIERIGAAEITAAARRAEAPTRRSCGEMQMSFEPGCPGASPG